MYWRAKTWDQYNGLGWENTAPDTLKVLPGSSSKLSLEANQLLVSEDQARTAVTYTVHVLHPKDDLIFASSRPVSLTMPSRLDVSWRWLNDVYNVEATSPLSVPLELRFLLTILGRRAERATTAGYGGRVALAAAAFVRYEPGAADSGRGRQTGQARPESDFRHIPG